MQMFGKLIVDSSDNAAGALVGGGIVLVLIYLLVLAAIIFFVILLWWKIFAKTGHSGALSLLMLVPIANFIMICVLAFGEWPIHRELRQLRAIASGGRLPGPQGYAPQQYPPQQFPHA